MRFATSLPISSERVMPSPQSNLKHPFAERPAIGERRAQLSGIACSPRPRERDPDKRRDRLAIVACSNFEAYSFRLKAVHGLWSGLQPRCSAKEGAPLA